MDYPLLERDLLILEFLANFGYCHDYHIAKLCGLSTKYIPRIIKRLVDAGYIIKTQILAYKSPYLMLSRNAAKFLGIKGTAKPVLNTLYHDTVLVDLFFELQKEFPDGAIKTDKQLRREFAIHKTGSVLRIPDLLIDESVAIELELSEKSLSRLEQIINSYIINTNIKQVRYYITSNRLYKKINQLVINCSKFSFFMLQLEDNQINKIDPIISNQAINTLDNNFTEKKFGAYKYLP